MAELSVTRFIRENPDYRSMHQDVIWNTENVGKSYDYHDSVCDCNLWGYYGVLMNLFIRKCLCKRFGIVCEDDCTEIVLKEYTFANRYIERQISDGYEAYIDPENRAIDEIASIKMVALSHSMVHQQGLMEDFDDVQNMDLDIDNLKDVVKFLNQLPYGSMIYQEPFVFHYENVTMRGVVDFIFDDYVFCQIATSRHPNVYKRKYAQVLLYIWCHYGENHYGYDDTDQEYTVMIYNPLLGEKYVADVLMTPRYYDELWDMITDDIDQDDDSDSE